MQILALYPFWSSYTKVLYRSLVTLILKHLCLLKDFCAVREAERNTKEEKATAAIPYPYIFFLLR